MEGLLFLANVICMLILAIVILRTERKWPFGNLGLFAYRPDPEDAEQVREKARFDA